MVIYDKAINILKAKQQELALSSLKRPAVNNIEYEYGKTVGICAGLDLSINVLIELLTDEEYKDGYA